MFRSSTNSSRNICFGTLFYYTIGVISMLKTVTANDDDANSECAAVEDSDMVFAVDGGIILLIIGSVLSLWALAYVCEEFFVPALEIFCKKFKIPDSVAGCLVMAAGNDSPEVFVSFIGLFIQKSAIGVGTVIGSEIFNHMLISAGSSYYAKGGVLQLDPASFTRDCLGYFTSLVVFLFICGAKLENAFTPSKWDACLNITIAGSLILIIFQLIYTLFVAKFDSIITLLGIEQYNGDGNGHNHGHGHGHGHGHDGEAGIALANPGAKGGKDAPVTAGEGSETSGMQANPILAGTPTTGHSSSPRAVYAEVDYDEYLDSVIGDYIRQKEKYQEKASLIGSMKKTFFLIFYYATIPIKLSVDYTTPNVHDYEWERYYGLAIFVCIFWLGVYAYVLLFFLSEIGKFLHIPSVTVGLTFSAIGTSFPNFWSSLVVARLGKGDMAISNALGSNTFNIFIALGLPWFVFNALNGPYRELQDGGIVYLTLMLIIVLVVYYAVIWACNFQMHKWMAIPMFFTYVMVVGIACAF